MRNEWDKLEGKNAWDYKAVRPKAEVIKEAKAGGRSVHFDSRMELCHIKTASSVKNFGFAEVALFFGGIL